MDSTTFEIESTDTHTCWASLEDGRIVVHRISRPPEQHDEVLLQWDVDVLHNLLAWATREGAVAAYFAGPMAHQIREHSKELGMTPEMFVWHAVKVFIEVGTAP